MISKRLNNLRDVAMNMRIGGFEETSMSDWAGNVTYMIFMAGCNFRCRFCYNSHLIPLDSGYTTKVDFFAENIEENIPLLDAVGVSGGEPLLQGSAVLRLFALAKRYSLKTFLNTNCSIPMAVEAMTKVNALDYVAMDFKAPLKKYGEVIKLPYGNRYAGLVLESLDTLLDAGVPVEARTTIVKDLIDGDDDIRDIAQCLRGRCEVYYLQKFTNKGKVLDNSLKAVSDERMNELAEIAVAEGLNARVRDQKV